MQKRALGSGGLQTSAIGYGCMALEGVYGPAASRQEGISLIRAAVDRGVTMFDTAEAYGAVYVNTLFAGHPHVDRACTGPEPKDAIGERLGGVDRAVGSHGRQPERCPEACSASQGRSCRSAAEARGTLRGRERAAETGNVLHASGKRSNGCS